MLGRRGCGEFVFYRFPYGIFTIKGRAISLDGSLSVGDW